MSVIIHHFFPASNVLASSSPVEDVSHRRWIDSHWMAFLQMAQDIDYIFRLSATDFLLGVKIRRVLLYILLPVRDRWEHALLNDPVLDKCADEELSNYIASLYQDTYKLATQIPFAPAFVQLRVCRLLFGDIKRFVSRRV